MGEQLTGFNENGDGNGTTFADIEEYVEGAASALEGMCLCNLEEVIAYMALKSPELFREAMANVSKGCFDVR
jgi:hypothetical protein